MSKRIIILGAGLAGLSAAWHLKRKGSGCLIFEKEKEIGGLCRSKKVNGFIFDCDGHLLHFKNTYTSNLIKTLLKGNLLEHQRNAWVYSHSRYIPYPFQANLYGLPADIIKECLLGLIQANKNGVKGHKNGINFLSWIERTFGRGIAKHFMVPYNTKFWTVPPERLTCEWLDGFIPVPSLSEIIDGTIQESNRQFGYNARFWYPKKGGIAQLPQALANDIKNIYTNCQVAEINPLKKEIKMVSGHKERFDYLISTLPLPEMAHLIKSLPNHIQLLFRKLRWNSIFNLNLGVDKKDCSRRHWVYFPHQEPCFFRIGFYHNFSPSAAPAGKSALYVEVSYTRDKPIEQVNIIKQIKKDLKALKILDNDEDILVEEVNDIKYGYPIYNINYNTDRRKLLEFLSANDIISCGRFGSWRYMSMEDVILEGRNIAIKI